MQDMSFKTLPTRRGRRKVGTKGKEYEATIKRGKGMGEQVRSSSKFQGLLTLKVLQCSFIFLVL